MRRARIKVMATVPARRKQAVKEEDLPNSVSNETVDRGTEETNVAYIENIKQTANETANLPPTKNDINSELQQPLSVPEIIDSPIVKPNNDEVPEETSKLSESIIDESSDVQVKETEKNSETPENITKENHEKQTREDAPIPGSDEMKTTPCHDISPVTKVLQTRTSFMRPTPRLDGGGRIRRNSVQGSGASASESEDDCRRTPSGIANRMRNDSVSSMQSPNNGPSRENSSTGCANIAGNNTASSAGGTALGSKSAAKFGSRQKRKVVVSESARKLAEARREFLLKHENKQPDRAKLTMYDLIYYNPVTNPMKQKDPSLVATQTASSVVRPPTDDEEEEECETSEAMPVPQVKVGPDGHLVIDEQSLVIEHTGAKKNRQALARTEALVDEENNGSGFYKKRAKTKDWPKWETLKFYKALNGVGTDFLLMQSLFPNRSRQEIKMKFKKEEKINRCLIEKALTYHQEFDIDSLKEDLATFEETENSKEYELLKSEKSAPRQPGQAKRKKNKSRRMVALSIGEDADDPEPSVKKTIDDSELRVPVQESIPRERKRGVQRRNAIVDTWTRSESSSSDESASDTEVYQIKPTRSGRIPKVRKLQAPTINTLDNMFSDHDQEIEHAASPELPITEMDHQNPSNSNDERDETIQETIHETISMENLSTKTEIIHNPISGMDQVEPGSLVIVSRESTDYPGETVLQVYMVSSDIDDSSGMKQNMTPVVLTPELLNTVTAGITKVSPIDVKTE